MTRTLPVFLLLGFLAVLHGCGLCPDREPPLTQAEADKFVTDCESVVRTLRKGMLAMRGSDDKNNQRMLLEAANRKILELGWEGSRYQYIYDRFHSALGIESLRMYIARLEKEALYAATMEKRQIARDQLEQEKATLHSLRVNYRNETTPSERVLVHERLSALARSAGGSIASFHPSGPPYGLTWTVP